MKFLERFTAVGLLLRCLATLRQIARAQERLAAAAEAELKIAALRANIKPSQLAAAFADAEKDEPVELLTQTEKEIADLYRAEVEARERGVEIPEGTDPLEFLRPEEKDDPFLER